VPLTVIFKKVYFWFCSHQAAKEPHSVKTRTAATKLPVTRTYRASYPHNKWQLRQTRTAAGSLPSALATRAIRTKLPKVGHSFLLSITLQREVGNGGRGQHLRRAGGGRQVWLGSFLSGSAANHKPSLTLFFLLPTRNKPTRKKTSRHHLHRRV